MVSYKENLLLLFDKHLSGKKDFISDDLMGNEKDKVRCKISISRLYKSRYLNRIWDSSLSKYGGRYVYRFTERGLNRAMYFSFKELGVDWKWGY